MIAAVVASENKGPITVHLDALDDNHSADRDDIDPGVDHPVDRAVKCIGEKTNCDPSNWKLIPRGLLPLLNGKSGRNYDGAPAELKPTIMAVAELQHRARKVADRKSEA